MTTSWFWFKVPPGFNIVVCTCIGSNGFHLSVLNKALASGGGSVVFRGRVVVLPILAQRGKTDHGGGNGSRAPLSTARSIIIDPCQKTYIGRTPYFDS